MRLDQSDRTVCPKRIKVHTFPYIAIRSKPILARKSSYENTRTTVGFKTIKHELPPPSLLFGVWGICTYSYHVANILVNVYALKGVLCSIKDKIIDCSYSERVHSQMLLEVSGRNWIYSQYLQYRNENGQSGSGRIYLTRHICLMHPFIDYPASASMN